MNHARKRRLPTATRLARALTELRSRLEVPT